MHIRLSCERQTDVTPNDPPIQADFCASGDRLLDQDQQQKRLDLIRNCVNFVLQSSTKDDRRKRLLQHQEKVRRKVNAQRSCTVSKATLTSPSSKSLSSLQWREGRTRGYAGPLTPEFLDYQVAKHHFPKAQNNFAGCAGRWERTPTTVRKQPLIRNHEDLGHVCKCTSGEPTKSHRCQDRLDSEISCICSDNSQRIQHDTPTSTS